MEIKKMVSLSVMLLCMMFLGACGTSEPKESKVPETTVIQNTVEAATTEEENQSFPTPEDLSSLNGSIKEVEDHSFRVSEIVTEKLEDGSELAVMKADPDGMDLIEVTWNEDTVFTVRSSSDMGITSSDTAGSAADLEPGRSMDAKGSWDGDVFHAAEIIINHFE